MLPLVKILFFNNDTSSVIKHYCGLEIPTRTPAPLEYIVIVTRLTSAGIVKPRMTASFCRILAGPVKHGYLSLDKKQVETKFLSNHFPAWTNNFHLIFISFIKAYFEIVLLSVLSPLYTLTVKYKW